MLFAEPAIQLNLDSIQYSSKSLPPEMRPELLLAATSNSINVPLLPYGAAIKLPGLLFRQHGLHRNQNAQVAVISILKPRSECLALLLGSGQLHQSFFGPTREEAGAVPRSTFFLLCPAFFHAHF